MNKYVELKNKQQKEINAFPLGCCFNQEQFEEMMEKWNLKPTDTKKIYFIGAGCYIRKSDKETFETLLIKLEEEKKKAIAEDTTGDGFIYDMFIYELANHEYCITIDLTDTIYALGLSIDAINKDERLQHGLTKAVKDYLADQRKY